MSMIDQLLRLRRDAHAGISVLAGFGLTMLIGAAALAVDVGSLYLDRRKLQGIADAAVMAAAAQPGEEQAAVRRIIAANCTCDIKIAAMTMGTYVSDVRTVADQRFAAGGTAPNAVRLVLTRNRPLFFGRFVTGRSDSMVRVTATGARQGYAAFSLGSRVAAVNGGVPNAILSALTGSDLNLSVMDYRALASGDVDLLAFSDALRTELDADVLTFGQTLDSQVTMAQALSALARVSDDAASPVLTHMASRAANTTLIPANVIDLGPRYAAFKVDPAYPVRVNAMSLLRALLVLGSADRQVDLALASSLPGGSKVDLALIIGEPAAQSPLIAVTDDQEVVVRTAQVRLKLDARIATSLATVELPLLLELGSASARISDIDCRHNPHHPAVTLAVSTSPASLMIGSVSGPDFQDMQRPLKPESARILRVPLASVNAEAELILSDMSDKKIAFSRTEIAEAAVKTVSSSGHVQGATESLADRMDLTVNVLGIGISSQLLKSVAAGAVTTAAPVLDGLIGQVTDVLGVHIGQADARVNALRCSQAKLVG